MKKQCLFRFCGFAAIACRLGLFISCVIAFPVTVFAQNSMRDDANIDLKMNAAALSGVTPPTGAQTALPSATTQQLFDPYLPAAIQPPHFIAGQSDGTGRVYEVQGQAILTKKGSPLETKLKKGDVISAGDTILTEASSAVSINFDERYLNAVRIPENSKAVFESIEPTNIRIEDGSIFNSIDGLPQGSSWKVITPTTVAAVRGTLYLVNYQALNGQFYAATVNIPDDGKNSAIDIQSVSGPESVDVPEGKQITLQQGQKPDLLLVKDIDPALLEEILKFFKNLLDLQEEHSGSVAPPTGGQNSLGDGVDPDLNRPDLDQQDLGGIPDLSNEESLPGSPACLARRCSDEMPIVITEAKPIVFHDGGGEN